MSPIAMAMLFDPWFWWMVWIEPLSSITQDE